MNQQLNIDKMFLYANDPYKWKYQNLIKKSKEMDLKHVKNPKAFMVYSNDVKDVHSSITSYKQRVTSSNPRVTSSNP